MSGDCRRTDDRTVLRKSPVATTYLTDHLNCTDTTLDRVSFPDGRLAPVCHRTRTTMTVRGYDVLGVGGNTLARYRWGESWAELTPDATGCDSDALRYGSQRRGKGWSRDAGQ